MNWLRASGVQFKLVMGDGRTPNEIHVWVGKLRRTIDHVVPLDPKLIAAANLGEPLLARSRPFSRTARRMRDMVAEVQHLSDGPIPELPAHVSREASGIAKASPATAQEPSV